MSTILIDVPGHDPSGTVELEVPGLQRLDEDAFLDFCERNPELRIEMDRYGNLVVMPPVLPDSGSRELRLGTQLQIWTDLDGRGVAFSSDTIFCLPNGAMRSPDASWTTHEAMATWNEARAAGKKSVPICPFFVLELRSGSDRLPPLLAKMEEWIESGAALGILVDPREGSVRIHRPQAEPEWLVKPDRVSAGPEMPGLEFDLTRIW